MKLYQLVSTATLLAAGVVTAMPAHAQAVNANDVCEAPPAMVVNANPNTSLQAVRSAVYGVQTVGDQTGVVVYLADQPNLCAALASNATPPFSTIMRLAPQIADSAGNFYPTAQRGNYTVTDPNALKDPNITRGAFVGLSEYGQQCEMGHIDASAGRLTILRADLPTTTSDPNFVGHSQGVFNVVLGDPNSPYGGVFDASYCAAISKTQGELPNTCP